MKLISWNIDSLNAALTSDSARAKLSKKSSKPWFLRMQISLPFKKPSYPPKVLLKTPRNP